MKHKLQQFRENLIKIHATTANNMTNMSVELVVLIERTIYGSIVMITTQIIHDIYQTMKQILNGNSMSIKQSINNFVNNKKRTISYIVIVPIPLSGGGVGRGETIHSNSFFFFSVNSGLLIYSS